MITCRMHNVIEVDQHEGCWVCNLEERLRKNAVEVALSSDELLQKTLGILQQHEREYFEKNFNAFAVTKISFKPKNGT
jgi:hypothetical protein